MTTRLNKYSKNTGNFIVGVGILHLILGFVENWTLAIKMLRSGIVNTADKTPEQFGFFWYQSAGLFVLFTGNLIQHYLNESNKPLPEKFGYYLLMIAITGCILEPVSGFYVFIPIALLIIFSSKKISYYK